MTSIVRVSTLSAVASSGPYLPLVCCVAVAGIFHVATHTLRILFLRLKIACGREHPSHRVSSCLRPTRTLRIVFPRVRAQSWVVAMQAQQRPALSLRAAAPSMLPDQRNRDDHGGVVARYRGAVPSTSSASTSSHWMSKGRRFDNHYGKMALRTSQCRTYRR